MKRRAYVVVMCVYVWKRRQVSAGRAAERMGRAMRGSSSIRICVHASLPCAGTFSHPWRRIAFMLVSRKINRSSGAAHEKLRRKSPSADGIRPKRLEKRAGVANRAAESEMRKGRASQHVVWIVRCLRPPAGMQLQAQTRMFQCTGGHS